jgi:hypothetical protein
MKNKKCDTIGRVPISNRKLVERCKMYSSNKHVLTNMWHNNNVTSHEFTSWNFTFDIMDFFVYETVDLKKYTLIVTHVLRMETP